jgi:hypothetical protein
MVYETIWIQDVAIPRVTIVVGGLFGDLKIISGDDNENNNDIAYVFGMFLVCFWYVNILFLGRVHQ